MSQGWIALVMMATVAVAVAAKKAALTDKLLEDSRGIGQELD